MSFMGDRLWYIVDEGFHTKESCAALNKVRTWTHKWDFQGHKYIKRWSPLYIFVNITSAAEVLFWRLGLLKRNTFGNVVDLHVKQIKNFIFIGLIIRGRNCCLIDNDDHIHFTIFFIAVSPRKMQVQST